MPGARILLVEDDEVLRDLLARNLEVRGHEVRFAEDARNALAQLRATVFDLIVLDICLPDQTGWDVKVTNMRGGRVETLAVVREEQNLPVVALAAERVSPSRFAEFHPLA